MSYTPPRKMTPEEIQADKDRKANEKAWNDAFKPKTDGQKLSDAERERIREIASKFNADLGENRQGIQLRHKEPKNG